MKFWIYFLLIVSLAACGVKTPDCADEATKAEVLNLVNSQVNDVLSSEVGLSMLKTGLTQAKNMFAGNFEAGTDFGRVGFSLDNVVNSQYDESTDKYVCTASLNSSFDKNHESIQIRYVSQIANNGEKQVVTMEKLSFRDLGALFSVMLTDITEKHSAELKKLRLEIGDDHVSEFTENKCNGFEKDERLCSLGHELGALIEEERKRLEVERKDYFRQNLNVLRDTYNRCGDRYYKEAGLVRNGEWIGAAGVHELTEAENRIAKTDNKFSVECSTAAKVANEIGVKDAFEFMPDKSYVQNKMIETQNENKNATQGIEEHEEIDDSQEVSLPQ